MTLAEPCATQRDITEYLRLGLAVAWFMDSRKRIAVFVYVNTGSAEWSTRRYDKP